MAANAAAPVTVEVGATAVAATGIVFRWCRGGAAHRCPFPQVGTRVGGGEGVMPRRLSLPNAVWRALRSTVRCSGHRTCPVIDGAGHRRRRRRRASMPPAGSRGGDRPCCADDPRVGQVVERLGGRGKGPSMGGVGRRGADSSGAGSRVHSCFHCALSEVVTHLLFCVWVESMKRIAHTPQALTTRVERRRCDSYVLSAAHIGAVWNNVHNAHDVCDRDSAQLHLCISLAELTTSARGPPELRAAAGRQWALISTPHGLHLGQNEPVCVISDARNQAHLTVPHTLTRNRAGRRVLHVIIPLLLLDRRRRAHDLASLTAGKPCTEEDVSTHRDTM